MRVLMLLFLWLRRPRHRIADTRSDLVDVPVAIEGLAKEFKGGLRAVDGITYQVPKGKVIGLLGPNGAGKTTTMRMVLGLILPTEGDVFVFGERNPPEWCRCQVLKSTKQVRRHGRWSKRHCMSARCGGPPPTSPTRSVRVKR